MRNRALTTATLAALVLCPLLAAGQTSSAEAAGKVGIINLQQAIITTEEGKKAFTDLQAKYRPRQEDLAKRQQEAAAIQDQIQRQMATLSDDEEQRLTRELDEKQKILKRMTEDAQSDFQDDRQDIMRRIGEKMVKVIDQYAQQHGLELVLEDSPVPVYFAAKGVDITQAIVTQYNTQYPEQAASSEGTPSTAPAAKKPASKTPGRPNQ